MMVYVLKGHGTEKNRILFLIMKRTLIKNRFYFFSGNEANSEILISFIDILACLNSILFAFTLCFDSLLRLSFSPLHLSSFLQFPSSLLTVTYSALLRFHSASLFACFFFHFASLFILVSFFLHFFCVFIIIPFSYLPFCVSLLRFHNLLLSFL